MTNEAMTLSSIEIDDLVLEVLDKVKDGEITTIPTSLENVSFNDLIHSLSPQDLNKLRILVTRVNYNNYEYHVLESICQWNVQNSSGELKVIYSLLCSIFKMSYTPLSNNTSFISQEDAGITDVMQRFHKENVNTIRRLIKSTIASGPVEAKMPLVQYTTSINYLTNLNKGVHPENVLQKEREAVKRYLGTTDSHTTLVASSMDRNEYMARVLIQTLKSISEYKSDQTFSNLRSFLNNAGHICSIVRMFSNYDQKLEGINRLACDLNDQVHSLDRMLSSNAVLARQVLSRLIETNDPIYSDVLALTRHQHRIIAVDTQRVIILFSYLFKEMDMEFIQNHPMIHKALSRMFRYTNIAGKYMNEASAVFDEIY